MWRHVPTKSNPADNLSGGINPYQTAISTLWWLGPQFIQKEKSEWPKSEIENNKLDGPLFSDRVLDNAEEDIKELTRRHTRH